jgi:hypothetical protein
MARPRQLFRSATSIATAAIGTGIGIATAIVVDIGIEHRGASGDQN